MYSSGFRCGTEEMAPPEGISGVSMERSGFCMYMAVCCCISSGFCIIWYIISIKHAKF